MFKTVLRYRKNFDFSIFSFVRSIAYLSYYFPDQYKQDRTFAATLQFQKGDMCLANIAVSNNVRELHEVKIEEILEEKNQYIVSSPDMREKLYLPLEDLKPLSNGDAHDSYKNLPGYYNKNDYDREGEFQAQRRRGRGGRRNREEENRSKKLDSPSGVSYRGNSGRRERGGYKATNFERDKGANRPIRRDVDKRIREERISPDIPKNAPNKKPEPENESSPVSAPKAVPIAEPGIVTSPAASSPNAGEQPDSKKIAQSSESPAAFWGRMRNSTPTATVPKTAPIAQKGADITPPSAPSSSNPSISKQSVTPDNTQATDSIQTSPSDNVSSNSSDYLDDRTTQADVGTAYKTSSNSESKDTVGDTNPDVKPASDNAEASNIPLTPDIPTTAPEASSKLDNEDQTDGRSTPQRSEQELSTPSSPVSLSDEDSARANKVRENILIATNAKLPVEATTAEATVTASPNNVSNGSISPKIIHDTTDPKPEVVVDDDIINTTDLDAAGPQQPSNSPSNVDSIDSCSNSSENDKPTENITGSLESSVPATDESATVEADSPSPLPESTAKSSVNESPLPPLSPSNDPPSDQKTPLLPDPIDTDVPTELLDHVSEDNVDKIDIGELSQGPITINNSYIITNVDDPNNIKDKSKKKVSFGSTTEIIENQGREQVVTVNSNGIAVPVTAVSPSAVSVQPEPGKIILPPEIIEKHQNELTSVPAPQEYPMNPHMMQQQPAAFIHAGMPLYHAPPMMMPNMFYPPTAVNEQYHIPNNMSRDPEGKDLPDGKSILIFILSYFFTLLIT